MSAPARSAEHGFHPSYIVIWFVLVVLLAVSIGFSGLTSVAVGVVFAFFIAVVKALMVGAWFMHLNIEKRWVWLVLGAGVLVVFIMWLGVAPDVMEHQGLNWAKIAAPPAGH